MLQVQQIQQIHGLLLARRPIILKPNCDLYLLWSLNSLQVRLMTFRKHTKLSTSLKAISLTFFNLYYILGETSTTPLSPLSPMEDSSDAAPDRGSFDKPRLQRSHVPSKKTFKFRRSRKSKEVCKVVHDRTF